MSTPPGFLRQQDILTPDQLRDFDVDLVGAGALGGAILICLLKMGFGLTNRVRLVDFDRCAAHNVSNQWFRHTDAAMGASKVQAVADAAGWLCEGRRVDAVRSRFRGDEARPLGPLVILAVDSLVERRAIWQRLRRRADVAQIVDGRMGAEVLDIYRVDLSRPAEVQAYESSLADAEEARDEPCTRRAIMYTTFGAAGLVGSLVRAVARRELAPRRLSVDFRHFLMATESGE